MNELTSMPIVNDMPRAVLPVVENQKNYQWVNNNEFYSMIPAVYYGFYTKWVRLWLQWADGYVPYIHGGQYGLLSTNIANSLISLATDKVVGSGFMYKNSRKPKEVTQTEEGKPISKALDFISNIWAEESGFEVCAKRGIKHAYAGGFSIIKLNYKNGELWCDELRADRFFIAVTSSGEIRRCVSVLSFYNNMLPNGTGKKYSLVEERYYVKLGLFGKEVPVVEYRIYDSSVQVQYSTMPDDNFIPWEDLPKEVRYAFKGEYGNIELNKPQALNGFTSLGVYMLQGSDEVTNVPQIHLGESLLAPVLTYLYEYDHCNTAFNTDIYLARGRVMLPTYMQKEDKSGGSLPHGFDDFLFTKVPGDPDGKQPEAVQFNLRSEEWKNTRNHIIENIASGIKMSATTIATYLQGGAMRTAREVSAEEDMTTLFVENARKRFERPLNKLIEDVLRFYGYVDDVQIRWTKAGMTNQTVLVDTLSRAVEAGLISRYKAHALFNADDDEEQQIEDYQRVEEEQRQAQPQDGGFYDVEGLGNENSGQPTEQADDSDGNSGNGNQRGD